MVKSGLLTLILKQYSGLVPWSVASDWKFALHGCCSSSLFASMLRVLLRFSQNQFFRCNKYFCFWHFKVAWILPLKQKQTILLDKQIFFFWLIWIFFFHDYFPQVTNRLFWDEQINSFEYIFSKTHQFRFIILKWIITYFTK